MRFLNVYILLFIVLIGLSQSSTGQIFQTPIKDYSVKDGLPQSQVRDLYLDHKGMIWVATQSGITLFDGRSFHTHLFSGLKEQYVIKIKKSKKKLLLRGLENTKFFQDSLIAFHLHADMDSSINFYQSGCTASGQCWFLDDKSGTLGGSAYVSVQDSILPVSLVHPQLESHRFYVVLTADTTDTIQLLNTQLHLIKYDVGSKSVIDIDSLSFKFATQFSIKESIPVLLNVEDSSGNDFVFSLNHRSLDPIAFRQKGEVDFHARNESDLPMLITGREGAHVRLRSGSVYPYDSLLNQLSVRNVIATDKKVTIATDQGLKEAYYNGLSISLKDQWVYPWHISSWNDSSLCISTYRDGLHIVDREGKTIKKIPYPSLRSHMPPFQKNTKIPEALSNYLSTPNWKLWGSFNGFLAYHNPSDSFQHIPLPHITEAFAYDSKNEIIYAANRSLYLFDASDLRRIDTLDFPSEVRLNTEITDLHLDRSDNLWLSGRGGIARFKTLSTEAEVYTKSNGGLPFIGAISMEEDPFGKLWVGGTNGIARWNGRSFEKIFPKWIEGNINQLLITPAGLAVAVSPQNIYLFQIEEEKWKPIRSYNEYSGYEPTEPNENGIHYDSTSKVVWIPTIQNVFRLDLDLSLEDQAGEAHTHLIGINQKFIEASLISNEKIEGAFVELTTATIDPWTRNWNFRYRLNDGEISPPFQQSRFIISGLQHGKNKVQLIAQPTDESIPPQIQEYTLQVQLPLWERSIFLWILALAIALLIGILLWNSWQQKEKDRKLLQLERELDFNRLRTLEAYFNPHFIFNTLTTIQDNILRRNRDLGNELIIRLSRIFRYALRIDPKDMESGHQENQLQGVPLKQEVELVRDYIFLQQAQEQGHIRYIEDIEPGILEEPIYIPKLLIQPFVENIYKHAFPKNENEDQLKLHIERKGHQLLIEISDNGWGIHVNNKKRRTSLGKKLALERMEILRSLGIPNNIHIEHSEKGTVIQIYIHYESYHHRRQSFRH